MIFVEENWVMSFSELFWIFFWNLSNLKREAFSKKNSFSNNFLTTQYYLYQNWERLFFVNFSSSIVFEWVWMGFWKIVGILRFKNSITPIFEGNFTK
jgi:hypothetical protein